MKKQNSLQESKLEQNEILFYFDRNKQIIENG